MEERDRAHMRKLLPGRGRRGCGKVQAGKITGMNRERGGEEGGSAESWWWGARRHAEGKRQ